MLFLMTCSTIYRTNSWSRMKITFDMFRLLCAFSRMPLRFLDLIRGMGYKSSQRDEHFMSCYCYLRPGSDQESNTKEAQTQNTESGFGRFLPPVLLRTSGLVHDLPCMKTFAIISAFSKGMGVLFKTRGLAGSPSFIKNTSSVHAHHYGSMSNHQ
jgi:hypothetical protein